MKIKLIILIVISTLFLHACVDKEDNKPHDFVLHETSDDALVPQKYKADTSCTKGQVDCNVCANDVQQQFHDAVLGKLNWSNHSWKFNWNAAYDPDNATPKSIFGSPVKGLFGINVAVKHVQGFIRTNSNTYPYAGSHSHTSLGGVFIIKNTGNGLELTTLHQTGNAHPSGVQILGKYFVYGEGGHLVFKDIESQQQLSDIELSISPAKFGGGLGLVKLVNDNYLVITTGPGGEKNVNKKANEFYELTFQNGEPTDLSHLNGSPVAIQSGWNSKYRLSENLSVITECGTGDIYTVNVSGDTGAKLLSGKGYWKLSKLEINNDNLILAPVNYYQRGQNASRCNSRATGTVTVSADNQLEFYCHEHGKDKNKTASEYRFQKGSF